MEVRPNVRDPGAAAELARIEAAYTERDAGDAESVYSFGNPGYVLFQQLLEAALLRSLRRSPVALERASVLDIGCGSGYYAHRMLEFGAAAATGVDLMPQRIEEARERYPRVRFEAVNAAELPFADGEFELVTQFTCLSSVLDPSLRAAIAAEMWRVTAARGIIVSWDMRPEPGPLRARRALRAARAAAAPPEEGTPTTGISDSELRRLFPGGTLDYETAALDFELCAIAARSYLAARLLACVPPLRAHAIGVVTKG
jgi:ubiquinone/menaquinone biosynthesis C-methylase UbiE